MKKSIIVSIIFITNIIHQNVLASSQVHQNALSAIETKKQITNLSKQLEHKIKNLEQNEKQKEETLKKLSQQQEELFKKIENPNDKQSIIYLVNNLTNPQDSSNQISNFTTPNTTAQAKQPTTMQNSRAHSISDKIFLILSNLTTPTALLCTTTIIVTFLINGMITSGEISIILDKLITIGNRQIIAMLLYNITHFLPGINLIFKTLGATF